MNPNATSENQLVRVLQDHRPADFSLLYNAFSPSLYGVLLRLADDTSRAEDLLQDAFVKIWTSSHSYDPQQGRLFTWVLAITRNLALSERRARKVRLVADAYIAT